MFLTAEQLNFITGIDVGPGTHASTKMKQREVLEEKRVPYTVNRKGDTVVLVAAVNAILGGLPGQLPLGEASDQPDRSAFV